MRSGEFVELSDHPERPHIVWFHDGEGEVPVPFRSSITLRRFLECLPASSAVKLCERDRDRLADLIAREQSVWPQTAPAPAHDDFLQRVFSVACSAQPMISKRSQLLVLFRPLVSPRALAGLGRLSPDVLLARVQAECLVPGAFPDQVA